MIEQPNDLRVRLRAALCNRPSTGRPKGDGWDAPVPKRAWRTVRPVLRVRWRRDGQKRRNERARAPGRGGGAVGAVRAIGAIGPIGTGPPNPNSLRSEALATGSRRDRKSLRLEVAAPRPMVEGSPQTANTSA